METDLRYPIGRFTAPEVITAAVRGEWIDAVEAAPAGLRAAVAGLSAEQWDTPYRPGGWTVRQVVHHLPDSHLHAYVRMRLALTEAEPTVAGYDEKLWAGLPDARTAAPEMSQLLLEGLHRRWVALMRALGDADFARTFRVGERGPMRIDRLLGIYAWHGRHHVAHITGLRERMGWGR